MDHKYSKRAEHIISEKMNKMKDENRPQNQKVAIALDEARRDGAKVPPRKFHKLRKALGRKDEE